MSSVIRISGLLGMELEVTSDLATCFGCCGEVVRVHRRGKTDSAYVFFKTADEAAFAVKNFNGGLLNETKISVEIEERELPVHRFVELQGDWPPIPDSDPPPRPRKRSKTSQHQG